MAIRSRTISASSPAPGGSSLPAFLSVHAWPGLNAWLLSVFCSISVFSLLAGFAWHGTNGRLPDMTTLLVAIPCGALFLMLLTAALWKVLADIPLETGLVFIARIFPLAWLFPLVDLIRSAGRGFIVPAVSLDGPGYMLASITAGLLPVDAPIPLGMRAGILAATLISAFVVWFSRQHFVRSVIVAVVMSVALVKTVFLSSAMGIWHALTHGQGWIGGLLETSRETVRAITNGYWWSNIYDRFPSAVEQQSDISLRLTSTGLLVLALGVLLMLFFWWHLSAWKRIMRHTFRSWSALDIAVYAVGGAIITALASRVPPPAGTWWYALPLALLVLVAFRLHAVLERCLHRMSSEGVADTLVCGDLSPGIAADVARIAWVYTLFGAFALGWPIFVTVLAALAASRLSRDPLWKAWPWSGTVFRACGAAALALYGCFFVSQHARLTELAALIMVLAAAHRLAIEWMWKPRA